MSKIYLKISFFLLLTYSLIGFFLLPYIAKSQIIQLVQENSSAKIELSSIYFNPFSFQVEVDEFVLNDTKDDLLFSFDSFSINLEPSALFGGVIEIDEVLLDAPSINVVYEKNKTLNILSFFEPTEDSNETSSESPLPRIVVNNIVIKNGAIDFKDYTHTDPFEATLNNVDFSLSDIDTKDLTSSEAVSKLTTSLKSGGYLTLETSIKSLNPLVLKGATSLQLDSLSKVWQYIKEFVNYEIKEGSLHFESEYTLNLSDLNSTDLTKLDLLVENLKITPNKSAKAFVNLKKFHLSGAEIKPFQSLVSIDKVSLETLLVNIKRSEDSKIDIVEYLKVNTKQKVETKNTPDSEPFIFTLKELDISDSEFAFNDNALEKPMKIELGGININVKNITTEVDKWSDYSVQTSLDKTTRIKTVGKFQLNVLKQEGTFSLENLALKKYSAYLEESTYMQVKEGLLSLSGKTTYKEKKLNLTSSVTLTNLEIDHTKTKAKLISLTKIHTDSLTLNGTKSLTIGNLKVDEFFLNAKIDKKKNLNLASLLKKEKKVQEKKSVKKEPFFYRLKEIKISKSSVKFRDESLNRPFKVRLHEMEAVIHNVSNRPGTYMDMKLKNEIDKYASATVDAKINNSDPKLNSELKLKVKHYDMHSISPYSYTYAGHEIKSGALFLDLLYSVKNEKLLGQNNIILDKVVLGKETTDKNVDVLPLDTVLLILEDSDEKVDIDVSIDGDLSQPGFKYTSLFTKTITDIIFKVIYSPFSLIGKSMGMSSEDLQYVSFEFGKSEVSETEQVQLRELAKILNKQDDLILQIAGVYDTHRDTRALKAHGESVDDAMLQKLAQSRVNAVKEFLIREGKVQLKQIVVLKSKIIKTGKDKYIKEYLQIIIK